MNKQDLIDLKSEADVMYITMNSGKIRAMYTPLVLFGPFAGVNKAQECPYFFEANSKLEVEQLVKDFLSKERSNING